MVLINVYAPTEDKEENHKEIFYATLENVLSTSRDQVKLIMGNLNAKIGKKQCYRNIIGNYSLHATSNNNETKLIDFAAGKGLILQNTMFLRKDIHKYTWIYLDGKYKNQIGHVLISSKFRNCVQNIISL